MRQPKIIIKQQPQPLKILKGFIKKEYYNNFIEEYIYSVKNRVRLWSAIRLANSLKEEHRREYYVIDFDKKGLVVFNKFERMLLIEAKILSKKAQHVELMAMASYYTGWSKALRETNEQREYDKLKTWLKKK